MDREKLIKEARAFCDRHLTDIPISDASIDLLVDFHLSAVSPVEIAKDGLPKEFGRYEVTVRILMDDGTIRRNVFYAMFDNETQQWHEQSDHQMEYPMAGVIAWRVIKPFSGDTPNNGNEK